MCGIVGYIKKNNKIIPKIETIMDDLLYFDTLRGTDSTGVFYSLKKHEGKDFITVNGWAKDCVDGVTFIQECKLYRDIFKFPSSVMFMVGHNRSATRGKITTNNAHPFVSGNITLVHNGSLYSWHSLGGKKTFEVDSEAITEEISLNGLKECANKMSGAYSLVWNNAKERTLNFYRNKERPMCFVDTEDFLFFGSEPGMLLAACWRHGISTKTMYETKVHTHYKIQYNSLDQTIENMTEEEIIPEEKTKSYWKDDWDNWGQDSSGYYRLKKHKKDNEEPDIRKETGKLTHYVPAIMPHEKSQLGVGAALGQEVWLDSFSYTAVDPILTPGHRITFCLTTKRKAGVDNKCWFTGELILDKHSHISISGFCNKDILDTAENNKVLLSGSIIRVTPYKDKSTGRDTIGIFVDNIVDLNLPDPIYYASININYEDAKDYLSGEHENV